MYGNGEAAMQQDKQSRYPLGAAAGSGSLIGGSLNHAEPPRVPELVDQFSKLEKAVAFVEESVHEMAARLSGFVRPPAPEPTAVGNQLTSVGPSTGFGTQLHEQHQRVGRVGERIQDLLRRLEV